MDAEENYQDFRIREASLEDAGALATLHIKTFRETHGGGPSVDLRHQQWQGLFQEQKERWFCLVIEHKNGDLLGFTVGQPYRHQEHGEYQGELNKIYLLSAYQKQGLGRKLLCSTASAFIERNITSMLLFGDSSNPSNGLPGMTSPIA